MRIMPFWCSPVLFDLCAMGMRGAEGRGTEEECDFGSEGGGAVVVGVVERKT